MSVTRFSPDDLSFIEDTELIIRKNNLVRQLFAHLSDLREELTHGLSQDPILNIKFPHGKISKGENYRGFPYLVLDYPSIFKKDNIFAYRTIVWWGHFYSNNIILKGKYLSPFKGRLFVDLPDLKADYFFLGRNPWQHDFDQSYIPIKELSEDLIKEQILNNKFVKVAQQYDLKELNKIKKNTLSFFKKFREKIID